VLSSSGKSSGNRLSKTALYDRVKKYAIMAGISKNVSPHLFRHSGISIMDKKGVSPSVIKAQSGHRDMKTLMGYCHPDKEHIRREFDRTLGDGGGSESRLPERNPYDREPTPGILPSESSYALTNGHREQLLMDSLITGRISEATYNQLMARLQSTKDTEDIGYIG
jgi:hypothetical protein